MVQHVGRWFLPLVAVFLLGPACASLVGGLKAGNGSHDVSLIMSSSPAVGIVFGSVCLLAAALVGIVGARSVDARTGTLSAGLVVGWAAWRTGTLDQVLLLHPHAMTLVLLAIEGLIVGSLGLVAAFAIMRGVRPSPDDVHGAVEAPVRACMTKAGLVGAGVGAVAALVVAHIVVFSPLRGQALGGAVLGGIAAGAIGSLAGASVSDKPAAPIAIFASMLLAACVAPLVALVVPGVGRLPTSVLEANIPGPVLVQPLDWVAGMFIGVPIGMGWASASIGKTHTRTSGAARTAK